MTASVHSYRVGEDFWDSIKYELTEAPTSGGQWLGVLVYRDSYMPERMAVGLDAHGNVVSVLELEPAQEGEGGE